MDKSFSKIQSDELWNTATQKLDAILKQYEALPKGVHMRTDSRIFPSSAVYLTVKPIVGPQKTPAIIENAAIRNCAGIAAKLEGLMRVAEGILVDCELQKPKVTRRVIEIFAGSKRLKFTRLWAAGVVRYFPKNTP